jgi:hypothetical protein
MRIATLTSLIIVLLVGCSTTIPRSGSPPTTAEWKKGDFRVRFQAAPGGKDGRSFSFYDITHTAAQFERSLVMESAHTLEGFNSRMHGDPKNWIRIIEDSNGRALLIEENIPNDCGPCMNYVFIHLDSNGRVDGEYLKLPTKVTGPANAPINYSYPKVRSLDGDVLRYDYSTGGTVTKRIDQIEKSDRPTPPG